jgi:hypothetical protein
VDALFVAAEAHVHVEVNEKDLIATGLLGKYRREMGWVQDYTVKDRENEIRELQKKLRGANNPAAA